MARVAGAAGPSVDLRFVDRDAIPELRDELRVLGAMRVPMVVFLTANFHEIGRYGDRALTVNRAKAAMDLGATCPLPGSADGGALGRRNRRVAGHVAMASGLAVAGLPRVVEMLTDEDCDEIWNLSDALIGLLDTKEASRGTSTDSQPTATPH